ncbi:MAG: pectinesterase family protein [Paludibacteraceae bacterium]|nr:pectinesterase family protein [Paludibacteraceae bacterium]
MKLTDSLKKGLRFLTASVLTTTALNATAATPAFPGAEGYGMYTTGGRGGKVYHVTNLSDDGKEGSLRYAVNQKGARTIVFDVSGIIELNSQLSISNGDITIAGQTAPGDGICLKNYNMYVNANNVIIRFMRFRLGTDKPDSDGTQDRDAIWGRNRSDIILDHCSMSWCTDECASFYGNKNFTMQWCLIAESLRGSLHPKGYHGYGGIWGGQGASFHHNMLANNDSRNPRLCGSRYTNQPDLEMVDLRNNVVYNWGNTNSGYAGEGGNYNFVNNYYKSGPATKSSIKYRIFEVYADDGTNSQPKGVYGHFYVSGNYMNEKGANWDWNGMDINNGNLSYLSKDLVRSNSEFKHTAVTTHTAENAFKKVCALAGASLKRDAVDARIANEALTGKNTYVGSVLGGLGIIDKTSDVGGWPKYNSTTKPTDTDGDGMPDAWESAKGLNPNDATDGAKTAADGSGYTNLELYMNSLVCEIMSEGLSDALTPSDYSCESTPIAQDSAKLIKHGVGSSNQTVNKGAEITSFFFNWENATAVTVEGDLPEGVTYSIDNSAKAITFSGVAYDEAGVYNATVKTKGGINEAVYNISFTVKASGYSVNKQKFNFVVGVDGDFKAAKAAAEVSRSDRFYIFVPNGNYNIGALTGDSNQKTSWKAGKVSLIGQSMGGVTLYNKSTSESIGTTATLSFTSSATDLYLQDLTLQNKGEVQAGAAAGRFVVICDEGKKNIFKNVRLLSGQDTYYSRTNRSYWENSEIHGTVDFICGYGDVFFNKCTIYLEYRSNANVIAAPATKDGTWGYVFRDCTIDGDPINNNRYNLGRSWQGTPKAVYINTTMKQLPSAAGWGDPMNVNPAVFAEYNSVNAYGSPVDLSKRRTTYTKDGATVYLNPVLSANDAAKYTVSNVLAGTDNWTPDNDCKQVSAPRLKVDGNVISWVHNDSALCYFIFKNGTYLANTAENTFTMPGNTIASDVFTVRSANAMGGLGPVSKGVNMTGIVPSKSTFFFHYGNGNTTSTAGNDITDKWNCTDNDKSGYGWAITSRTDKSVLYGADINYYGTTYKTFKNSKGAQSTFYLPKNVKPTKITFIGYSNATDATAVLSEVNGKSVSLPLSVNTSASNYTTAPAQVSYTFTEEVCNSFTFTINDAQACFIIALETEECDCTETDVEETAAETNRQDGPVYDIQGRRVYYITPGRIYIQNGHKFKIEE